MQPTFRAMRRKERQLGAEEAGQLLSLAHWGVLSLIPDDNGYPYAIPISCAYVDGALLFHCAGIGSKLELIERDNRACFTATISYTPEPAKFTAHYESVVCYGHIETLPEDERMEGLIDFTAGTYGIPRESIADGVRNYPGHPLVLRMTIDHMTAKRSGPINSLQPKA